MKEGDLLELVREPDNDHDDCAIAFHFNGDKIGYVPAEENALLTRLIDAGVIDLLAEITHLKPEAATWENVHAAIYLLKEEPLIKSEAIYLSMLETPRYFTLKHSADKVTRIAKSEEDIMAGTDFYEVLNRNRRSGNTREKSKKGIPGTENLREILEESLVIINKSRIPPSLAQDDVIKAVDGATIELNLAFDEKGYVVANIERLAGLMEMIEKFKEVKDRTGHRFLEVIFKKG
jgi:hypothetical protein